MRWLKILIELALLHLKLKSFFKIEFPFFKIFFYETDRNKFLLF